jgi:hypothetical protein
VAGERLILPQVRDMPLPLSRGCSPYRRAALRLPPDRPQEAGARRVQPRDGDGTSSPTMIWRKLLRRYSQTVLPCWAAHCALPPPPAIGCRSWKSQTRGSRHSVEAAGGQKPLRAGIKWLHSLSGLQASLRNLFKILIMFKTTIINFLAY